MTSSAWNAQDQAMTTTADDDFHQFLDMSGMGNLGDGMHFDFQGFQHGAGSNLISHSREPTDTIMANTDPSAFMSGANAMMQHSALPVSSSVAQPSIPAHLMATPDNSISDIDAQIQYLQQQKIQQQQRQLQEQQAAYFSNHNHSVPPTPQSMELPGGTNFYSQAEQVQHQGVFDRGYHQRLKEQHDMAFTPLVSPAVTPLDPHFNLDHSFPMGSAYFSPLTSPALHAQNDPMASFDPCHNSNSPIDMDLEVDTTPVVSTPDPSKKTRKKSLSKIVRGKTNIRSSPIVKPQRKKTGPSPAIVSHALNEVEENNAAAADMMNLLPLPAASTETSEDNNSSVSPENLNDMPPPPLPARRSMSRSPYIQAQNSSRTAPKLNALETQPAPATPASLMKLPASNTSKLSSDSHDPGATDQIESLELPESVSNTPLASASASASTIAPAPSPRIEVVGSTGPGSGFQALPSPVFVRTPGTVSASQSPQLRPGSSSASGRTPKLAPRGGRKRSTGSIHASPALLPKISPNIKPLIPGTPGLSSAEDTASRLLMSKSNYQNILEGNIVPGITYPSELSTNLTSKRTSHKIAEQGRRNRINSALQVMASLLPGDQKLNVTEDLDKKDGKQANVQNSKASVVESAIVHMKTLQKENGDLKQELLDLKKRIEELSGSDKAAEPAMTD